MYPYAKAILTAKTTNYKKLTETSRAGILCRIDKVLDRWYPAVILGKGNAVTATSPRQSSSRKWAFLLGYS